MFALGVVSLVQVCFLPGYVLVRALRLKLPSWLSVAVVSFGLSLTANSFVIFPLTALGLYVRPVVIAAVVVELALVVVLIVRRRRESASVTSTPTDGPERERPSIGRNAFAVLVLLLSSYWFVALLVKNAGTIFTEWDAVVSWNRWAVQWADSKLPYLTWLYPQLLPANWSVSYVLMGDNLQFFAKGIMPLFALFVLAGFLDLALRTREPKYVWAFAITCVLYRALLPKYVASGYSEFAVAFLAFAAVYCLINAAALSDGHAAKGLVLLGAVLAGGCAVTKQGGLFMVLAYPALVYVLFMRTRPMTAGVRLRLVGLCLVCILLVAGPWYVYKEIQIALGQDRPIVGHLVTAEDLHGAKPFLARLPSGIGLIGKEVGGRAGLIAIAATLLLGLLDRTSRSITCIVLVPYTLIWGFLFEYTLRNYSLALPFLGLTCGTGIARGWQLLERLAVSIQAKTGRRLLPRAALVWTAAAVLIVVAGLVAGTIVVSADRMRARQHALLQQIGRPELNAMLYRCAAAHPFGGKIITDYQLLGFLPDIGQYRDPRRLDTIPEAQYADLVAGRTEDLGNYLLFSGAVYPRLLEAVSAACEAGQCEVVGTCGSWYLVRIVGGPGASPPASTDDEGDQAPP